MRHLFIVNDPPYGSERPYNALRLANALVKAGSGDTVIVFLMADAVLAAKRGQATPDGFYNIERMLSRLAAQGGEILLCGTCLAARGIADSELVEGARRSTVDALAQATRSADKVLVF